MKFKIGKYYSYLLNDVFKCIDKKGNIYLFERVDDGKYISSRCYKYNGSSKLCKKCNNKTVCSKYSWMKGLKEIPKLKAILLYS